MRTCRTFRAKATAAGIHVVGPRGLERLVGQAGPLDVHAQYRVYCHLAQALSPRGLTVVDENLDETREKEAHATPPGRRPRARWAARNPASRW